MQRRAILSLLGLLAAAPLQSLPVGQTWVVDAIDGKALLDASRATVRFENGQVAGKASCTTYSGPYRLLDGRLDIGPLVNARTACPALLADQEARFMAALEGARRFQVRADGVLVLSGPAGRLLFRAEGRR